MMRHIYCIAAFAFFVAGGSASAGPADHTEVVKMILHPMPATQPALSHSLLPRAIDQSPGNAATLYMIAARKVPDYSNKDVYAKIDDLEDLNLEDLRKKDKEAQDVLDQFSTSLEYVDLGARREEAQWDAGLRDLGARAMVSYLNDMRLLQNVLCVQYRLQLSRGDFNGAERSLQSAMAMSRQLSDHPLLVQGLVQCGFVELVMQRGIAEWVSQPGAPNLYWALTALPTPIVQRRPVADWEQLENIVSGLDTSKPVESLSQQQAIAAFTQALTVIRASQRPRSMEPIEKQMNDLRHANLERGRHFLELHGFAKQAVQSIPDDQVVSLFFLLQFRIYYDDVWKCIELPYWQVASQLAQIDKAFKAEAAQPSPNPLVLAALSSLRICYVFERSDWDVAQMRTIEAIRDYAARHGGNAPAALYQISDLPLPIDPFTGKPFQYHVQGKDAVLECPLPSLFHTGGRRFELSFEKPK